MPYERLIYSSKMPGLCSDLPNPRLEIMKIIKSRRGWWSTAEIDNILGLQWRGRRLSIARNLTHLRNLGLVESIIEVKEDNLGNEKQSNLIWNLTRKGREYINE